MSPPPHLAVVITKAKDFPVRFTSPYRAFHAPAVLLSKGLLYRVAPNPAKYIHKT